MQCPDQALSPGAKDLALGLGADADIVATGELVANVRSSHHSRKAKNEHDGVGAGIAEPILGKGRFLMKLTAAGHLHGSTESHRHNNTERTKQ
jgi:hypothetical protein